MEDRTRHGIHGLDTQFAFKEAMIEGVGYPFTGLHRKMFGG